MKAALLALSITLWAPYQCGTEPDERPQEDSAPKALWNLAEKFEKEGNSSARDTTLHQLVEQYPASRYAQRAREEMGMPSEPGQRKHHGDDDSSGSEKEGAPADPEAGEE